MKRAWPARFFRKIHLSFWQKRDASSTCCHKKDSLKLGFTVFTLLLFGFNHCAFFRGTRNRFGPSPCCVVSWQRAWCAGVHQEFRIQPATHGGKKKTSMWFVIYRYYMYIYIYIWVWIDSMQSLNQWYKLLVTKTDSKLTSFFPWSFQWLQWSKEFSWIRK